MDIEIELEFDFVSHKILKEVGLNLSKLYKLTQNNDQSIFYIGYECRYSYESLDKTIIQFLNGLNVVENILTDLKGKLRIGIFYNMKETVVFPVILSIDSVTIISQFCLCIDITGYPCFND